MTKLENVFLRDKALLVSDKNDVPVNDNRLV